MAKTPIQCPHLRFSAEVQVDRIENPGGMRFMASVRIQCVHCETPMRFIGLPAGVDINGAMVDVDGTEGRFAIAPRGEVVAELEGAPQGFTVRRRT